MEARRALSKMFDQVNQILQEGKPRAIGRILNVFITLRRKGYHDLCLSLRNFIGSMATIKAEDHPLGQICQLLSALQEDSLDEAITQTWKCVIDGFIACAEPFCPDSVFTQLNFIEETYGARNGRHPLEAEMHFQKLLTDCQASSSADSKEALRIMFSLADNLLDQQRYDEADVLAQYILPHIQNIDPIPNFRVIEAIEFFALCQYYLHKRDRAEANIRHALKMAKEEWGSTHASTIRIRGKLERWLREWGREEEADNLQVDVGVFDMVIGPDETDVERVQGVHSEFL